MIFDGSEFGVEYAKAYKAMVKRLRDNPDSFLAKFLSTPNKCYGFEFNWVEHLEELERTKKDKK